MPVIWLKKAEMRIVDLARSSSTIYRGRARATEIGIYHRQGFKVLFSLSKR
jgi:hypothetical protein